MNDGWGTVEQQREWFAARDTFLGVNFRKRDIVKGFELASKCVEFNAEARWLCSLFPQGAPSTLSEAREVFVNNPTTDGKSIFYAGCMVYSRSTITDAAAQGYARALAMRYREDRGVLVHCAEHAHEPQAFYTLSLPRVTHDEMERERYLKTVVELGHLAATFTYADEYFCSDEPEAFRLLGMCLEHGAFGSLIADRMSECVKMYRNISSDYSKSVFVIGGIARKYFDYDAGQWCGYAIDRIKRANLNIAVMINAR